MSFEHLHGPSMDPNLNLNESLYISESINFFYNSVKLYCGEESLLTTTTLLINFNCPTAVTNKNTIHPCKYNNKILNN